MVNDRHSQAEGVYRQILDLLEDLSVVFSDEAEAEEDEDARPFDIDDVISAAVEEAAERGLDEESAERIFKAVAVFAEKAAER
jgi:hypothetical protein